jgi:hypothetical protein
MRIAMIACAAVLAAAGALFATGVARTDGAAAQVPVPVPVPVPTTVPPVPGPTQYVLKLGDSFRVDGADIGCQVTRRGSRPTIECKRGGKAKGTYGSFLDAKRLVVARFHDSRTAQTILTAKHGGGWRACTTSRAARIAKATHCR